MMGFAVVPYIHGVTEPIERILCSYNVKVAQKPFLTLNHIFAKPIRILCQKNKNQTLYIPSRAMTVKFKRAPKSSLPFKKDNSALLEHTCQTNHTIAWDNSKIIITNRRYHQRRCLEAWHINSAHAPLNRDDGGLLPDAYLYLINR